MLSQDEILIYQFYGGYFIFLLVALYISRKIAASAASDDTASQKRAVVTPAFAAFQKVYLVVYLVMMTADWLQGPYVYALYRHYDFSQADIGILFVAGFGSSLIFGALVGVVADKYGRKLSCILFALLYGASCVTKHFNDFNILLIGRILGGISTSILFSSFEAWMVHEHHHESYPEDWLALTFSKATAGNSMVAIGAGIVANAARERFGPVAPFDVSLCFLGLGALIIALKWNENYGDSRLELSRSLGNAWDRLVADPKVFYLGLIQSFYEGAMYIFVFMWTPALESTSTLPLPHGLVFASFMMCVALGSTLFNYLNSNMRVERIAMYVFAGAAAALFAPAFIANHSIRLLCFSAFEVSCGMFWPTMGCMRSRYVPEDVRATVMNMFRIPLNLIVVVVLANVGKLDEFHVFLLCTLCLLLALLCQLQLLGLTVESADATKKTANSEAVEKELSDLTSTADDVAATATHGTA